MCPLKRCNTFPIPVMSIFHKKQCNFVAEQEPEFARTVFMSSWINQRFRYRDSQCFKWDETTWKTLKCSCFLLDITSAGVAWELIACLCATKMLVPVSGSHRCIS